MVAQAPGGTTGGAGVTWLEIGQYAAGAVAPIVAGGAAFYWRELVGLVAIRGVKILAGVGVGVLALVLAFGAGALYAGIQHRAADQSARLAAELAAEKEAAKLARDQAADAAARARRLADQAAETQGAFDAYRAEIAARPPPAVCELAPGELDALRRLRRDAAGAGRRGAAEPRRDPAILRPGRASADPVK